MRVDKITMAHSLEARVPFLDTRIIEFIMSLKENIKLPNKKIPKYLLKKAAEGIIPDEIIYRKKQGFAAPIKEWLKKDWYNEVYNSLINSFFVKEKIFNIDYIKKIYYIHRQGKFNFQNEIFILYILNLWYKKYLE
jgi:asparagine synthase (glutamine-hydrolysing)